MAVTTAQKSIDDLEQVLWSAGAVSVTVEDAGDRPLYEPGPGETPLWDDVVVTGLFEDDVDLSRLQQQVELAGFTLLYVDELEDRVWEREWLSRFQPMQFGKRLWVCPTGHEVPAIDAIVMHLDPGLAFGTGTHATTRLCLEWLDEFLTSGASVLDFGCGSGILGIAALLLGAREVVGIDTDPQAITATRQNAERNGVEDKFAIYLPGAAPERQYDVVLANILAQPLIDLASEITGSLKPGGKLALSGVMESQRDWVQAAYPGITFSANAITDGWVRLAGVKR